MPTDFEKPGILMNKEFELQSKLQKMDIAALPKPKKDIPIRLEKMFEKPRLQRSTPEYYAQIDMRDLVFENQLNKIAENALPTTKDYRPSKIDSHITQEMIEDYQNEAKRPVEIDGKQYKYHPASIDKIDLEVATLKPNPFDPARYEAGVAAFQNQRDLVERLKQELKEIAAEMQREMTKFDDDIGVINKKLSLVKLRTGVDDKTELTNRRAQYAVVVRKLNDDERAARAALVKEEDVLSRLTNEIADYKQKGEEIERENAAEEERVRSTNQARIRMLEEELNALNKGNFILEQQKNETDEEYRDRLLATGQATYDEEEIKNTVKLSNMMKFKKNLRELFDNEAKNETIYKLLSPEQVYETNKRFTQVKKKFLEVYGYNNKLINEREAAKLIADIVDGPLIETSAGTSAAAKAGPAPATGDKYPEIPTETLVKALKFVNDDKGRKYQTDTLRSTMLRNLAKEGVNSPDLIKDLADRFDAKARAGPGAKGTAAEFRDVLARAKAEVDSIETKLGYKIEGTAQDDRFVDKIIEEKARALEHFSAGVGTVEEFDELAFLMAIIKYNETGKLKPPAPISTVGSGLIRDLPRKMKFGKISINPDKLYYKNILSIRSGRKGNNAIAGVRDEGISDSLVKIIMNIMDGKAAKRNEIMDLSSHEKILYDNLLVLSGLHKTQENTKDNTAAKLKYRLKLIEGEIEAGNNNIDLLKELHSVLYKMSIMGLITYLTARKRFKEINIEYFGNVKL